MELVDILHLVLAGALIVLVLVLLVIGFYVITLLTLIKTVLSRIEFITFNLTHLRTFAKMNAMRTLSNLISQITKGGETYGKSR